MSGGTDEGWFKRGIGASGGGLGTFKRCSYFSPLSQCGTLHEIFVFTASGRWTDRLSSSLLVSIPDIQWFRSKKKTTGEYG